MLNCVSVVKWIHRRTPISVITKKKTNLALILFETGITKSSLCHTAVPRYIMYTEDKKKA